MSLLRLRRSPAQLVSLLVSLTIAIADSSSQVNEISMNEHDTRRIYEHWMHQAYTALITAVASERSVGASEITNLPHGVCHALAKTNLGANACPYTFNARWTIAPSAQREPSTMRSASHGL